MDLIIHQTDHPRGISLRTWSDTDIAFFENEKAISKVRKTLANLNIDGTVHVCIDEYQSGSLSHPDQMLNMLRPKMTAGLNLFLLNNVTTPINYYPLTAWMMMHRLHHSSSLTGIRARKEFEGDSFTYTPTVLIELDSKIEKVLGKIDRQRKFASCKFLTKACSMGSARRNTLSEFHEDIAAELFAQLIITGDIKFKPIEEWDYTVHETDFSNHDTLWIWKTNVDHQANVSKSVLSKSSELMLTLEMCQEINSLLEEYRPRIKETLYVTLESMKKIINVI